MPVNVIGTLKPKNNGKFPVAEAVDIKVTEDLRLDEALENKADLSTVNFALSGKADNSDINSLQSQINEIITPVTQDAEVQNARVDTEGTAHSTLGERLASDYQETNTKIGKKLDAYEDYISQEIEVVSDKMIDVTNGSYYDTVGTESIQYEVSPGESYIVTGWHFNNTYCGLSFTPGTIRQTSTIGAFEKTVTIPLGVTKMRINGRTSGGGKITIKKLTSVSSSEFWTEYREVKNTVEEMALTKYRDKCGVRVTADSVVIYLDGYDNKKDLRYVISKKSGNGLPDFSSLSTVVNNGDNVSVADEEYPDYIFSSSTDFLSPSCVYAVDDVDGDFPSYETQKLTGGWHMYNNATTGDYSATARNISFTVHCDGKKVTSGNTARGTEIVVDIVNRLQGSNTEKEDGTGREIIEQHFRITFGDGFKAKIRGEITALEAIKYSLYYGISTINITSTPVRFIGCRTNRQENAYNSVTRCGDKNCTGTQQITQSDIYEMHINPSTDLGTMYANKWDNSCIISSGKSYMVLIYGTNENDMLSLSNGDMVCWEGYIELNKKM